MNHASEVHIMENSTSWLGISVIFYYRFIPLKPGLRTFRKLSGFMDNQCAFLGLYFLDEDSFSELL